MLLPFRHDLVTVLLNLFAFGLVNAGVVFSAIAAPTWLVLAGLVIGKPLGITLFGWFAANVLRLGMPEGMNIRVLLFPDGDATGYTGC